MTQLKLLKLIKNDSDFASQIGWNRTGLSSTYAGKRPVSLDLIGDICHKFELVNPKYLTGEENTMLLDYPDLSAGNFLVCSEDDAPEVVGVETEETPVLRARVSELEDRVRRKDEEIAWLRGLVEKLSAR